MKSPEHLKMEESIGQACYVLESCPDWGVGTGINFNGDRNTVIEMVGIYQGRPAYRVMNAGATWYVHPEHIQFKPLAPPKPLYTSTCSICHSPSLNKKGVSFCSNVKCKSWRVYKKTMPAQAKKILGTYEDPIEIVCPVHFTLVDDTGVSRRTEEDTTPGHAYFCFSCCKWRRYKFEHNKWYKIRDAVIQAVELDGRWTWSYI